ncbi:MAG TPA: ABC transporter ATP-binding protein [Polyangia bacterium]|nr:ABC transporter ATP-binding protein [Polyangia bacterium]
MSPAQDERKPPIRRATLTRVARSFAPYWQRGLLVGIAVVGTSVLGLANPLLVRQIIDRALPAHDLKLLAILAAGMVAVTLLSGAIDTLETWQTTLVGQRVMFDLRTGLYSHLQRMALRFFTETRTGEILSRVTADVSGVQELVTTTASQILTDIIMTISTLALMLALDWKLTLICVGMLPLFVYPTRKAGAIRRKLSKESQARVADLSTILEETLSVSGALLTKTYGRQQREIGRFNAMSRTLLDLELRRAMLSQLFWVSIQTFWAVAPALIYLVGGRAVAAGHMTLGSVVAFVTLQNRLFFPVGRLFGVQVQIQGALALFDRIFEYMDLPVEVADAPGAPALEVTRGEVVFDRVTFGYRAEHHALAEVSFTARPGELTALVGPSGAGKTTITYLIPRLYDVTAGAVRIDGKDVREVSLASVGLSVGVVTQETFLFHTTIRENLAYARPAASDEELYAAARAAQIHERILQLPEGYDTVVGERGYKLSGGERQRLAIARVILKNAPIVILDEATSALDSANERLIQAALDPLMKGRSTIAIAHRLSTVLRADQILVVDQGRIVDRGTHAELYRRGGLYARLVDEQFGAAKVAAESDAPREPQTLN